MRTGGRLHVVGRAFRSARGNRDLRLVQAARLASVTGRWAYVVTFAVFAYRSAGATGVALAAIVRLAPAAAAAPLTGAIVARLGNRTVLRSAGFLRAGALAAAGVAALLGVPAAVVYVFAAFEAAFSAVLRPVQQSLVPALSRTPGELTSTNLALSVIESLGVLVGPLSGAFLLQATDIGFVFEAAAFGYLVSAVLLLPLASRDVEPVDEADRTPRRLGAVDSVRDTRLVLVLYAAQNVAAGALNVLLVVAALRLLDLGQSGVGALTAALGGGGVIAGGLLIVRVRARHHGADLAAGLVLVGVPLLLLSATGSKPATFLLLAVVGVGITVVDVSAISLLQRDADRNLLAHTLGLLQATFVTSVGVGTLLAPALEAALGVRGALLATGVPLPVLALALWSKLRRLDRVSVEPPQWLEILRADPIFAPLPEHALEHLAAQLRPVMFDGGDVVFYQGDPGDAFYLVASGEVAVEIDGRRVRTLPAGASFGEIALLRDVPRTATIRSTGDSLVLRLDRGSFLSAVGGNSASARAADLLVGSRLGLAAGLSAA